MRETTIFILIVSMFVFMVIVANKQEAQNIKETKVEQLVKHKVDSMRSRYGNLFLLTLELNNITEQSATTKKAKRENVRVKGLMFETID